MVTITKKEDAKHIINQYNNSDLFKLISNLIEDLQNKPSIIDGEFARGYDAGYLDALKMIKPRILLEEG